MLTVVIREVLESPLGRASSSHSFTSSLPSRIDVTIRTADLPVLNESLFNEGKRPRCEAEDAGKLSDFFELLIRDDAENEELDAHDYHSALMDDFKSSVLACHRLHLLNGNRESSGVYEERVQDDNNGISLHQATSDLLFSRACEITTVKHTLPKNNHYLGSPSRQIPPRQTMTRSVFNIIKTKKAELEIECSGSQEGDASTLSEYKKTSIGENASQIIRYHNENIGKPNKRGQKELACNDSPVWFHRQIRLVVPKKGILMHYNKRDSDCR